VRVPPTTQSFFLLVIVFIGMTVIGTLSHEFGHWLAAWMFGYDATISYAATHLIGNVRLTQDTSFWFTVGGPLQSMLTGTIGVLLTLRFRGQQHDLNLGQWAVVFTSLFWLRPLANGLVVFVFFMVTGSASTKGDEFRIARHYGLPVWSIVIATALVGALVLAYITFFVVPRQQRRTFLAAGLCGGVAGYLIWLKWLGPVLMPAP
jgi:hypothetical protein